MVAFDLYGTLLDVASLAPRLRAISETAGAELLGKWRTAQLERTWELNRRGQYEPFDAVTGRALEQVAPHLGPDVRARMCDAWLSLPAFDDAADALEALAQAGMRRAVLSNGTQRMIRAALDASGLEVDQVFSADDVRAYKTDARVYSLLPRERTLFVSGNGWDAEGAKRFGLQVAWVDRGGAPPAVPPDLRVASLAELAREAARPDWRGRGVRVVSSRDLDTNTPQTAGMSRAAAITHARSGAEKLWAGTVTIHPNAKTGAHHHGELESVIYVVRGRARMRWGERLEFTAEAGPGDFIYVPPYVPHQEINASRDEPLDCVLVRSGQEPVVVNLDIAPAEQPEDVRWIDAIHRG
jgi:2-haloalkanoic acid dehalogenase type II